MKKILVPIDNTKVAKAAVVFAANLSASMGGQIVLLSVINATNGASTLKNWRDIEQQLVNEARESVATMLKDIQSEIGKTKVSHRHVSGFPVPEVVNRFVRENAIDLVVMGTAGATGLKRLFGGSITAAVIDGSNVPVITVPHAAAPKPIKRIMYATDMTHLSDEIKTITHFARPFGAEIEVVHLTEGANRRNRSELQAILIRMTRYPKIHLSVAKGTNIATSLRTFATKHKADIIVMFTHQLDFFEKLFGKGVTREVVSKSSVPLLAFNRTNTQL